MILFRRSGKYYTEEEWEVPAEVPRETGGTRPVIVPADMEHSPDFRRIDHGAVLVESQEPWGYPHLFPADMRTTREQEAFQRWADGGEQS